MKNAFILLAFAFFNTAFLQAQVLEDTRVMSKGSQPALTIALPGADMKFVDSEWKEFMKPYGKVTRVKGSNENVAAEIQILDIGGVNRLYVYSLSEAGTDGAKLIAWIDLGTGFVNSEAYPKEYVAGVKLLKDFAQKVKVDQIAIELEEQQKKLAKAESNLSKLQRENENLHKIIEDSKKRIAQAEQDIEKNLQDQEIAQKEIGAQTNSVETVQKKLEEAKKE